MNIDWKRKLTSRKLWVAVAGLVVGIFLAFNEPGDISTTITGCVMSLGSVVAYIVGEGLTDVASIKTDAAAEEEPEEEAEEAEENTDDTDLK